MTLDSSHLQTIYSARFAEASHQSRMQLWGVLCRYWIQRYVSTDAAVLDLAAGQCEFINQIVCRHKVAVDLNEDTQRYAAADVQVVIARSDAMIGVNSDSMDVVFVSNFFEHLPTKQVFLETLVEIRRVLKPGGKLLILQPNIRLLNGAYWDFLDHYLPLTDRTLVEAMTLARMRVDEVKPRFLPYTTLSPIPRHPLLVRAYLAFPLAQWLMGKQTWLVASKPHAESGT